MESFIQSAGKVLDRPGFDWKSVVIGFSAASFVFKSYLQWRQIQNVQKNGDHVPAVLKGKIDEATALKSSHYSASKLKFGLVSGLWNLGQNLAIYKFDVLPQVWSFAGGIMKSALFQKIVPAALSGVITHSLVFIGLFAVASTILDLPFSYYETFVLEAKYGFNKSTPGLWLTDKLKGLLVGAVLGGPIIAAFLRIIDYFGYSFMYYLTLFMVVVQVVLILIYPKFIQPLFNKLSPLPDGELKTAIEELAGKNQFPLDQVLVVDGSKRSSHSNAYFMGLPFASKKIVLFDTLVEQCTTKQVVAVLGHEIGHWYLSHIPKLLIVNQAHLFSIFTLFSAFFRNKSFYASFGFVAEQPTLIGFLLFNDVLVPVDSLVEFFMNLHSRKCENEADEFSTKQGYGEELKQSLIILSKENLSSLTVDSLYSAYTYNHPHLVERLKHIDEVEAEMKKAE